MDLYNIINGLIKEFKSSIVKLEGLSVSSIILILSFSYYLSLSIIVNEKSQIINLFIIFIILFSIYNIIIYLNDYIRYKLYFHKDIILIDDGIYGLGKNLEVFVKNMNKDFIDNKSIYKGKTKNIKNNIKIGYLLYSKKSNDIEYYINKYKISNIILIKKNTKNNKYKLEFFKNDYIDGKFNYLIKPIKDNISNFSTNDIKFLISNIYFFTNFEKHNINNIKFYNYNRGYYCKYEGLYPVYLSTLFAIKYIEFFSKNFKDKIHNNLIFFNNVIYIFKERYLIPKKTINENDAKLISGILDIYRFYLKKTKLKKTSNKEIAKILKNIIEIFSKKNNSGYNYLFNKDQNEILEIILDIFKYTKNNGIQITDILNIKILDLYKGGILNRANFKILIEKIKTYISKDQCKINYYNSGNIKIEKYIIYLLILNKELEIKKMMHYIKITPDKSFNISSNKTDIFKQINEYKKIIDDININ